MQISGPGRDAYLFADASRPRLARYLGRAPAGLGFYGDAARWSEDGRPRSEPLKE